MSKAWRVTRWVLLVLALVFIIVSAALTWLTTTSQGARWLLERGTAFLPVELEYQSLSGNLWRGLRLQSVDIGTQEDTLGFSTIHADEFSFGWNPIPLLYSQIQVGHLHVEGLRITLLDRPEKEEQASVSLPHFYLPFRLSVASLKLDDAALISASGKLTELPSLDASARLSGDTLQVQRLSIHYLERDHTLQGRVQFARQLRARVQASSYADLVLDGYCDSEDELSCHGDIEWAALSEPLPKDWQFPTGVLRFATRGDTVHFEGSSELQTPWLSERVEFIAEAALAQKVLHIQQLKTRSGGTLEGNGSLSWADGLVIDSQWQADAFELSPWIPSDAIAPDLDAALNFQLRLQGQQGLQLVLDADIAALRLADRALSGTLRGSLNKGTWRVSELNLRNNDTSLKGLAHFDTQDHSLATELELYAQDVTNLYPGLQGEIQAQVSLAGSLKQLALALNANAKQLRYQNTSTDSATLSLQARSEDKDVPWLERIRLDQLTLDANQFAFGDAEMRHLIAKAKGHSRDHTLSLQIQGAPMNSHLHALNIKGQLQQLKQSNVSSSTWQYRIQPIEFRLGGENPDHFAEIRLAESDWVTLTSERVRIPLMCIQQAAASLCVRDTLLQREGEIALNAALSGLSISDRSTLLGQYLRYLPPYWQLEGVVQSQVAADGRYDAEKRRFTRLDLALLTELENGVVRQLSDEDNSVENTYPLQRLQIELDGSAEQLELHGALEVDESKRMMLSGKSRNWQELGGVYRIELNSQFDNIQFLEPFINYTQELQGRADIALNIANTSPGADPILSGQAQLSDIGFLLPITGTRVKDWNLSLNASADTMTLDSQALIGNGKALIKGRIQSEPDDPNRIFSGDFSVTGERLTLVDLPDAHLLAGPKLTLKGGDYQWHLSGDVLVLDSFYTLQQLPESATSISDDAVIYGVESETQKRRFQLTTDIHLIAGDNVRFSGFGLTTEVTGRLHFTRDERRSNQLHGVLTLPEGEFKNFGQQLDIESGQLIFSGPVNNPRFDVRASRDIDEIEAGIWLTGSARQPKSELYSSPAMSDADVLSYLLTGKPVSEVGSGEGASLEASALTLGLRQALPTLQKLGGELGLSDVEIESGPAGGSGSIAAGKRINDRLYIKYRYGLVGAVGQFVIEYSLTDRLNLEAGSGETSSVDLTYNWKSRPGRDEDKKEEEEEDSVTED